MTAIWLVRHKTGDKFGPFATIDAAREARNAILKAHKGLAREDFSFSQESSVPSPSSSSPLPSRSRASRGVHRAGGGGIIPRWGMQPKGLDKRQAELFLAPLFQEIEKVPGGSYTRVDILRLLDRADEQAYRYVVRMLQRMMERQTEDERAMARTHHLNAIGFNKFDAQKAALSVAEIEKGRNSASYNRGLHREVSALLAKYSGRQLLEVLNIGAKKHKYAVRTNSGYVRSKIRAQNARRNREYEWE